MAVVQYTAPAVEPITLAEAKSHLRVVGDVENAEIYKYIRTARESVERSTGRALITRTFRQTWDYFPACKSLVLEKAPLVSVASVKYRAADGTLTTISSGSYEVDTLSTPGRVILKYGEVWPVVWNDGNAVIVEYSAGYGSAAADIPADLLHACFLLLGHFYANREPLIVGTNVAPLPMSVEYLSAPYRVYS